jgi:alpha-beta hydrolase superfamily lysophospholipase
MLMAVVALVLVAGGVTATVRALAGQPGVPGPGDNRPGDVLLVPGYGGSTAALDQLAGRITAAGGHAIVVQLAGDGTGDLQLQANVLNGYVNQALAAGSGPVTVIGYSAGGVVA